MCGCTQPTTAHVLGGCPSALMQGRFTFRHNQILYCLASELSNFVAGQYMLSVYADLPGMRASDSPQTTIPPSLLITHYCPDIVIYNQMNNSVALLELTCPLDSVHHLESARERKQKKTEYQQILSEFVGILCSYYTIELSVLGHYLPSSLSSFQNCVNFIQNEITMTCSNCRRIFDLAAVVSISSSRRIFMAKDCTEWSVELVLILIFNCTFPCHAHLYGIVLLYFVVACVRGLIHNIVITLFYSSLMALSLFKTVITLIRTFPGSAQIIINMIWTVNLIPVIPVYQIRFKYHVISNVQRNPRGY